MKQHAGFTLIELVIVISLLGVLTTIGISSGFTNQRDIGDLIAAEDAVIAEIRRARSANTQGLPRGVGKDEEISPKREEAELKDVVGEDINVDPESVDMEFGKYSFEGVEIDGDDPACFIEISKADAPELSRYLCVHRAIARVSEGKCTDESLSEC